MGNKTKPSEMVKQCGLKSLHQVHEITGVPYQTLLNWHQKRSKLFRIVVLGCKAHLLLEELSHLE